jgi:hypothetical protein
MRIPILFLTLIYLDLSGFFWEIGITLQELNIIQ